MRQLYCIVLYLPPVLNPKSHDGAQVLEALGRPMLVIGIKRAGEITGTKALGITTGTEAVVTVTEGFEYFA